MLRSPLQSVIDRLVYMANLRMGNEYMFGNMQGQGNGKYKNDDKNKLVQWNSLADPYIESRFSQRTELIVVLLFVFEHLATLLRLEPYRIEHAGFLT